MITETVTSMSATHPAVIEMQAGSTVFHHSSANSTRFLQSIQWETLVFLKRTVQLSQLDCSHKDQDLQLVLKDKDKEEHHWLRFVMEGGVSNVHDKYDSTSAHGTTAIHHHQL